MTYVYSTFELGRHWPDCAVRAALERRRDLLQMGAGTRLGFCLSAAALCARLRRPRVAGAHPAALAAGARYPQAGSLGRRAADRRLHHFLPALAGRRAHARGAGNGTGRAADPHPDAD